MRSASPLPARARRTSTRLATTPARIPCTPPEILDQVRPGDAIWFDDGRIGGRIESVGAGEVVVAITHARAGGGFLGAEKGINLPETDLRHPAADEFASANRHREFPYTNWYSPEPTIKWARPDALVANCASDPVHPPPARV